MQLIFVHVEIDNEDVGKPVSEYFGISGNGPQVIFFITPPISISRYNSGYLLNFIKIEIRKFKFV